MRKAIDLQIGTAGCLIWVAPRSLGGLSPVDFSSAWMGGGGPESVESLIKRGAIAPFGLYQDDGYCVRFLQGDLSDQENEEWTAKGVSKLSIPCGEVLVSGVLTPDFADIELPSMTEASAPGYFELGCFVKVDPGEYKLEVLAYPPDDLSAGWGHITDHLSFGKVAGIKPEKPLDYFKRTRPGEAPPPWINFEDEEKQYVNFIVRLSPYMGDPHEPKLADDGADVGIAWEFRKPDKCPLGIVADIGD